MKSLLALHMLDIYYIVWNIKFINNDNPYEMTAIADYVSSSLPGQIYKQEKVYINKAEIYDNIQKVKKL